MTNEYKHFSEDSRWVERAYSCFMQGSQSLNTRVIAQLSNIIHLLEVIDCEYSFYLPETYLISKAKLETNDEKSSAERVIKYLHNTSPIKSQK